MPLTIVTCNTYLCRIFGVDLSPRIRRRADLLMGELQCVRPDIICLQEVWSARMAKRMAAALPGYRLVRPAEVPPLKPMGTGLIILTRLAVNESHYLAVCSTGRPKEVLASKGLLWAELSHGGRALRVGNVHLGIGTAEAQRRQHDDFLRQLDTIGQVHLLCGDFNQSSAPEVQRDGAGHPHSRYLAGELSARGYRDVLVEIHGQRADRMVTADSDRNPLLAPGFHLRLDYIWSRSDNHIQFEPASAQVWLDEPLGGTHVSDHYGVRAEFVVQHGE